MTQPTQSEIDQAIVDIKQGWTVHANKTYYSDLTGVLTQSLETLILVATNQPTCVTVDELVSMKNGIDTIDAMWLRKNFPNGLKIIPNKQGDGDE